MRQTASIPSSSYSRTSTFLMQSLRQTRSRAADGPEVKSAELAARLCHLSRTIALGQHHHRAALLLKGADVGVHARGRRRAERSGRHAVGRLRRTRVVHRVVLQVLRHVFARVEALFALRVGDVARDDHGSGQRHARGDGAAAENLANLFHGLGEVDLDDVHPKDRSRRPANISPGLSQASRGRLRP